MDGYIAKPNDDLAFLDIVQKAGEDYGYADFIQKVDTVIIGRKTYDWVISKVPEFPHEDKDTYVITRNARQDVGKVKFYSGDLKDLISKLKSEEGKNIFCDGGAEIVNELLKDKLIDELVISIIPILLGDGTRLFKDGRPEQGLTLLSTKRFYNAIVSILFQIVL